MDYLHQELLMNFSALPLSIHSLFHSSTPFKFHQISNSKLILFHTFYGLFITPSYKTPFWGLLRPFLTLKPVFPFFSLLQNSFLSLQKHFSIPQILFFQNSSHSSPLLSPLGQGPIRLLVNAGKKFGPALINNLELPLWLNGFLGLYL